MAQKQVYVGSVGPFLYDDGSYYGLETDGAVKVGTAPSTGDEAVRLDDMDSRIMSAIPVLNIDDPSAELANYNTATAAIMIVYEANAESDAWTFYAYDDAVAGGANTPYVCAALSSGYWVAIAGRYKNGDTTVKDGNYTYYGSLWRRSQQDNDLILEFYDGTSWIEKERMVG